MATYYSDHYSADVGSTGHFTTRTANKVLPVGIRHARLRRTSARIVIPSSTDLGSGDIIRVFDMRSSTRLVNLYFSMDADFGATTTFDIGLYKKGSADDGAVIDADLFASAVDWAGAIARVDYFTESTTFTDMDRGKPLWTLADIGAGTYTEDPQEMWTIAVTTTQDISAVAAEVNMLAEAIYVAND